MKQVVLMGAFLMSTWTFAQSYVDSAIKHFALGEYDEAMKDFKDAEEIMNMITETSKAKIFFYRGSIWLDRAEKGNEDAIRLAYEDLIKVVDHDKTWESEIGKTYDRLKKVVLDRAEASEKEAKKTDDIDEKVASLDTRIEYLRLSKELGSSSLSDFYLGQANKQAGDAIFESTTDVSKMLKAKKYYEEALQYYELARYEDPFSKDVIQSLLTLSTRLGDVDRIAEYEKLLELSKG